AWLRLTGLGVGVVMKRDGPAPAQGPALAPASKAAPPEAGPAFALCQPHLEGASSTQAPHHDTLTIRNRLDSRTPSPRPGAGPGRPVPPLRDAQRTTDPPFRRETAYVGRIGSDRDDRQPPEPGGLPKEALARHLRRLPRHRPA